MPLISDQSPNNEAKSGLDVLIAFVLHHTLKNHVFIKKKNQTNNQKCKSKPQTQLICFKVGVGGLSHTNADSDSSSKMQLIILEHLPLSQMQVTSEAQFVSTTEQGPALR